MSDPPNDAAERSASIPDGEAAPSEAPRPPTAAETSRAPNRAQSSLSRVPRPASGAAAEQSPSPTSPYREAHPIRRISAELKESRKKRSNVAFDEDKAHDDCRSYVARLAKVSCSRPKGFSQRDSHHEGKCKCLERLDPSHDGYVPTAVDGVAKYMVWWASLPTMTRNELFREQLRYATAIARKEAGEKPGPRLGRTFLLPQRIAGEGVGDDEIPIFVCRNAVCALLDVGRWQLGTIRGPSKARHGNVGKSNRTSSDEWKELYAALETFFARLKEENAAPLATRKAGEADSHAVALPPDRTKPRVYAEFCWERGWIPYKKDRSKNIYASPSEYERRPFDDDAEIPLWPSSTSEFLPVPSWSQFKKYWHDKHSNLYVRAKGDDGICADCRVRSQEFRHKRRRMPDD